MRKKSGAEPGDELRKEYDLSQLKSGVRGKYHRRAIAGTNLVLLDPDVAKLFPDSDAVNRALRILADAARTATSLKSGRGDRERSEDHSR